MAAATSIDVTVAVSVPDEAVRRCCRILEMWMDDNPDAKLIVERVSYSDRFRYSISIQREGGANG